MSTLVQESWGDPPRDLQPGTLLGDELVVKRVLGYGGTAVVYEAHHTALKRDVAVKVCCTGMVSAGESRARLLREAKVYEQIRDARLPRVYSVDELEDGTAFMAMEKLEGVTLATLLDQELPSIERASQITLELLDVLEAVHRHGVVHRDVKPANVILSAGAEGLRLCLIDFGVCKAGALCGGTAITRNGEILGTPAYMAPEQLTAQPIDCRVDVHAVGLILFELLTGSSPYGQGSFGEIVAAVLRDDMPSVQTLRPEVPAAIAAVVARATAKQPGARYASAAAMRDALLGALSECPIEASLDAQSGASEAVLTPPAAAPEAAPEDSVVRTVPHTRRRDVRRMHSRHDEVISPQPSELVARHFV
jgi:serine/threonine protein kinase